VSALQTEHITKRYTGHTALDDVSLTIPEGSIVGLLGPNGAGKTTLIRIINQIIRPDSGMVRIFGEPLERRHTEWIGYLPEERGLYRKMMVGEQLLYLAQLKGLSRSEAMSRLKTWFDRFGIREWWGKKVEDLSKGMAQKVQFIGTVIHKPRLIILDEPFSGFDPLNARLITDVILSLRDEGSTIIFSTHRMETVESLCDHVILINKARKVLEGTRRDVRRQFRTDTWALSYRGDLQLPSERFHVTSMPTDDPEIKSAHIRILESAGSASVANELLGAVMPAAEVVSFSEHIPSMADIFIRLVGGEEDESLRRHLGETWSNS